MQQKLNNGEEVLVKSARSPTLEKMDRAAGMTIAGFKIPDIKSRVVDGIRYDTYPSGKVVAQKEGISESEKSEIRLNAAENKEQAKANVKDTQDIEKSTKSLVKSARLIKEMHDLLKNNPDLTGPGYAIPLGIGSTLKRTAGEDLGKFTSAAGTLQAEYAKAQSSRSGIGLVDFYKSVKPDESNSVDVNRGMLQQHAKKLTDEFNDQKNDWERKNPGKEFPYKFPDLSSLQEDQQFDYPPQVDLEETAKKRGITVEEVKRLYKEKMEKKRANSNG